MRLRSFLTLVAFAALVLFHNGLNFAQEEAMSPGASEPDILWLWGDVTSVDVQKNELVVKYLDYETDQEKQITLSVDDKTGYENVKAIGEIKPMDTVSVDYLITADGKNLAKNISVEKPEALPITLEQLPVSEQTPTPQTTPAVETPKTEKANLPAKSGPAATTSAE